jgi:hypothetical protein
MNLTRKPQQAVKVAVTGGFPSDFPRFPSDIVDRFGSMEEHQKALDEWYSQLQSVLQRQQQALLDRIAALESQLAKS